MGRRWSGSRKVKGQNKPVTVSDIVMSAVVVGFLSLLASVGSCSDKKKEPAPTVVESPAEAACKQAIREYVRGQRASHPEQYVNPDSSYLFGYWPGTASASGTHWEYKVSDTFASYHSTYKCQVNEKAEVVSLDRRGP